MTNTMKKTLSLLLALILMLSLLPVSAYASDEPAAEDEVIVETAAPVDEVADEPVEEVGGEIDEGADERGVVEDDGGGRRPARARGDRLGHGVRELGGAVDNELRGEGGMGQKERGGGDGGEAGRHGGLRGWRTRGIFPCAAIVPQRSSPTQAVRAATFHRRPVFGMILTPTEHQA